MSKKSFAFISILFLLSIFLLRFPPIYILGIHSTLFTTESLAIFIVLFEFIFLLFYFIKNNLSFQTGAEEKLVLLFFLTQSLSAVNAINAMDFSGRYWKVIFGIILFFLIRYLLQVIKSRDVILRKLMQVLLVGAIVEIFFQLILFLSPNFFSHIGSIFIYNNLLSVTSANISAGKLLDDTYLEIITPLLLYYYLYEKKRRFYYLSILVVLAFISFASNFRYRLLAFIIGAILSFITFAKTKIKMKYIFLALFLIIFGVISVSIISTNIAGYGIINRILIRKDTEDTSSITFRLTMMEESTKMAISHPLFGVGLGNFYDFLPANYKNLLFLTFSDKKSIQSGALIGGSHNIFFQTLAESGFLGLGSLLVLLGYYIRKDLKIIRNGKNEISSVFIVMFWTFMTIAQLFPSTNLEFYFLFFLLRGVI